MRNETHSEIHQGSGNIFQDLGFPDADERLAKAEVAHRLAVAIRDLGKSQKEVASILGVDQPKVSALLSGKLAGFSLERLTSFLAILGRDVEIAIKDAPAQGSTGQVVVGPVPEPLFQVGQIVASFFRGMRAATGRTRRRKTFLTFKHSLRLWRPRSGSARVPTRDSEH